MKNTLALDELLEYVIPVTETGCWLWLGSTQNDYGRFIIKGENVCADKLSWELQYGELPDNQRLLHKCHVRCCVNPDHLVSVSR